MAPGPAAAPPLPGCRAQGRTRQESLDRLRGAIAAQTDALDSAGLPVPPDDHGTETLHV